MPLTRDVVSQIVVTEIIAQLPRRKDEGAPAGFGHARTPSWPKIMACTSATGAHGTTAGAGC
jgi:hypothetical protein